jgi:hypothetical protein
MVASSGFRTGSLFWGTFFTHLGVLLLLRKLDWLDGMTPGGVDWWPLALVFLGLGFTMRDGWAKYASIILAALIAGFQVYSGFLCFSPDGLIGFPTI